MRETSTYDEYPEAHIVDWLKHDPDNMDTLLRHRGIADPQAYRQALRDAVDDALLAANGPRMPVERLLGRLRTTH